MTAPKLISIHRAGKVTNEVLRANRPRKREFEYPTPERPLIISASELRDFMRCRVRHNWRHNARLEPITGSTNLAMGSLVANAQDAWYKLPANKRTVKRMEKIAVAMTEMQPTDVLPTETLELARAMLIGFAHYAVNDGEMGDEAIGLTEAMPELPFDLPLIDDGSIRVRGRLDVAFKSGKHKKTMAFIESKTAKSFKSDIVELNLQLSVYFWALRKLYPKQKSYIGYYQQLRKQMPGPRVTAPLFTREDVERGDEEIEQWTQDAQAVALDMLDGAIYPNPMDACTWDCDFKMACLQRGTPDLLHTLKTQFKVREAQP